MSASAPPVNRPSLVRQFNAHVWNEVWLEGKGWTRYDPTAVLAPTRLTPDFRTLLGDSFDLGFALGKGLGFDSQRCVGVHLVDAGIRCHENRSRSPEFPAVYVASYAGAQAET